jgi:hypothetical protein
MQKPCVPFELTLPARRNGLYCVVRAALPPTVHDVAVIAQKLFNPLTVKAFAGVVLVVVCDPTDNLLAILA